MTKDSQRMGNALRAAERQPYPFEHWLITDLLPGRVIESLAQLPMHSRHPYSADGSRAGSSGSLFVTPSHIICDGMLRDASILLSNPAVITAVEAVTSCKLRGSYLRISLCSDRDKFYLKPHTDISTKLLTMIIFISQDCPSEELGTDLFDADLVLVKRVRSLPNSALLFRPNDKSFHGFEPRKITGERRVMVVNYVTDEWLSKNQLTGLKID